MPKQRRYKGLAWAVMHLTSRCSRRGPRSRTDNGSRRGAARAAERQRWTMRAHAFGLIPGTLIVAALLLNTFSCAPTGPSLPPGTRADRIVIEKAARRLTLYSNGTVLKRFTVALGRSPDGPKMRRGDNRTPEGIYTIDGRNAESHYHRALHVSYPNAADRERARAAGVSPGGDIMIHGIRNGFGWVGRFHDFIDWTQGCIAVTDEEIEEIWRAVPDGTTVEIRP